MLRHTRMGAHVGAACVSCFLAEINSFEQGNCNNRDFSLWERLAVGNEEWCGLGDEKVGLSKRTN
jgi:hypothetical protein